MGDPDGDATLRVFLAVSCAEYVTGQAGVVDEEKAKAMAKEAEELGDKDVYYRLGDAYTRTGKHQEEAYACYEKAAKNGIIAAYSAMGLCLEAGIGVKSDIAKAVSWYKKAMPSEWPTTAMHSPPVKAAKKMRKRPWPGSSKLP